MAITALRLIQSAQLDPSSLGEEIVPPSLSGSAAQARLQAWVEANVLAMARAEVSVPLMQTTGHADVAAFVNARFPDEPSATRLSWISQGEALADAATLSYGRSELNKTVASNAEGYDKDSDQDRLQGNDRLKKLLAWAQALVERANAALPGASSQSVQVYSSSVPVRRVW